MNTFSVFPRSVLLLAGALVVTATTLSSAPADSRSPVNFTAPSPCGTLSFNAPTDTAIGAEPQILAVGDLDGDGDDDVVTPNYGAQTLTVRLSTGAGFVAAPGSPIALPGLAYVAQIGDFTGDSEADVAVLAGHDMVVLHGNGDGTFTGQTVTDVSSSLTNSGGILTAGLTFSTSDLNGDSKLDLVTAAPNASKVAVWLGTGSGGFTPAQDWADVGLTLMAVAIGDMNGDGRGDFVVGSGYAIGDGAGSPVFVFLQQLDGTFSGPFRYEAYKSVRSLALADLNGDNKLDLIAPDYYGHGYQAYGGDDLGRVSIFFGNGDGTFGAPVHPLTGADNPDSVKVADFDGDGDLDIATSNNFQRNGTGQQISILRGNGAGGFFAPDLYASVGNHPSALTSGDFDADGMQDLAWIADYQSSAPPMKSMINAAECDFTPPVIAPRVTGTVGGNGWYTDDVEVEWDVTDPESPIDSYSAGCNFIIINTDTAGTVLTCEATSAGGTSSQSITIKRDATPPTATASSGPPPNANGWRKTNVTIIFTGTDAMSGGVTCSPQVVVTTEGIDQSRTGYCYDAAGNESAAAVVSGINIDKTAPTINIGSPTEGAVYNRNQAVTASYGCADSLSTVASCTGTVASGQVIDTSKKANNAKLTVTATDKAGNMTKTTVTYSVK